MIRVRPPRALRALRGLRLLRRASRGALAVPAAIARATWSAYGLLLWWALWPFRLAGWSV
jgi:hypothetical protein